ncbi:UDP-2,3-diacylglucosamine diphosphatase [Alteromonas sp. ASW11-36]|uniref:UDP-2,3-diacylglucosamine hydrolase n=1 Tax=Alteromonas arenosi TaxID=3055817 RepID=A0ABT7SVX6_9ALTE|nr:UDP-2,3-diacylglucosamine diphosphatase [Alteromonas sp. ASW11-36]MDM7860350.1 UDP-2,3-diacylglucosamine diphosphatase [Alteromonas sp. ASW11-36]
MSVTYFISDLHLGEDFPAITRCFEVFMREKAPHAEALYVLGDLFEVWYGDDNNSPFNQHIAAVFKQVAEHTPVFFIHGNRDFMLGQRYANKAGFTILNEQTVIDLYGTPTLLLHGDELCTDDIAYMKFRRKSRSRWWQTMVKALPLSLRRYLATRGRKNSESNKMQLAADIMDVTPQAVIEALENHNVQQMIHGHTHRPDMHHLEANGKPATRIVLGDWYEQGSMLVATPEGLTLENIQFRQ